MLWFTLWTFDWQDQELEEPIITEVGDDAADEKPGESMMVRDSSDQITQPDLTSVNLYSDTACMEVMSLNSTDKMNPANVSHPSHRPQKPWTRDVSGVAFVADHAGAILPELTADLGFVEFAVVFEDQNHWFKLFVQSLWHLRLMWIFFTMLNGNISSCALRWHIADQ